MPHDFPDTKTIPGTKKKYATLLSRHKNNFWDYFDKIIKSSGSI